MSGQEGLSLPAPETPRRDQIGDRNRRLHQQVKPLLQWQSVALSHEWGWGSQRDGKVTVVEENNRGVCIVGVDHGAYRGRRHQVTLSLEAVRLLADLYPSPKAQQEIADLREENKILRQRMAAAMKILKNGRE